MGFLSKPLEGHMDSFIEKIVQKKRDTKDLLISIGTIIAAFIVAFAILLFLAQYISQFAFLLSIGAIYLGFRLQSRTNVEFEYLVTNGSLDIDKIISQRKRVRIFSADCKEFEAVGRVKSKNYGPHVSAGAEIIFAGTNMASESLYFVSLSYKGKKSVLYFEPDQRMIDSFRRFIPSKILRD
jgi:hypothetical protein